MLHIKKIYKILLIITISFTSAVLASTEFNEEDVKHFLSTVDRFDQECLDKDGNLNQRSYIRGRVKSCSSEAKFIQKEYEFFSEYLDSNPEAYNTYLKCTKKRKEVRSIASLTESVLEVSQKVSCTNEEKLAKKASCVESLACNTLRSIQSIKPVLPYLLRFGVSRYVNNVVENKGYDKTSCLDSSRSDCLTEIWSSFAANILATGKSLWSLIKKGGSALFGMTDYISKKGDEAHVAMVQKESSIRQFISDPFGWISDFMNKVKYSVQSWMKSSVFCQKWEGVPHMSRCEEPLESMDCMECTSVANATCAAMGVVASELGIAALTAGLGNVASAGLKFSPKLLSVVSRQVRRKVGRVAPAMKGIIKARKKRPTKSKIISLARTKSKSKSKSISKAKKVASVALKAGSIAKAFAKKNVKKVLSAITNFQTKVAENKIIKKASAVADKLNVVGRWSEKAAAKGIKISNKLLRRSANKVNLKASRVTATKNRGLSIIKNQRRLDRVAKVSGRHKPTDSHISSNLKGETRSGPAGKVNNSNSNYTTSNRPGRERETGSNSNSIKQEQKNQQNERHNFSQQKQKEQKNQRLVNNKENHKKKDEDDKESKDKRSKLADILTKEKLLKGFIASAGARLLDTATNDSKNLKENIQNSIKSKNILKTKVTNKTKNKDDKDSRFSNLDKSQRSSQAARDTLGVKSTVSKERALAEAHRVKEQYSKSNREGFIKNLKKSNSGMSTRTASRIFDTRKRDVDSAYDYIQKNEKRTYASESSDLAKRLEAITTDTKKMEQDLLQTKKQYKEMQNSESLKSDLNSKESTPNEAITSFEGKTSTFGSGKIGTGPITTATSRRVPYRANQPTVQNSLGEVSNDHKDEIAVAEEEVVESVEDSNKLETEVDEKNKLTKEIEKKRGVESRKLASILDEINGKKTRVERNSPFSLAINQLDATSQEAKSELKRLEKFLDLNPASLGTKTIVKTDDFEVHTYLFDHKNEYYFKIKGDLAEVLDRRKAIRLTSESL